MTKSGNQEECPVSIDGFDTLTREQCNVLWRGYFGAPFPKHLSVLTARPILAFEFQVRKRGGLDRQTRAGLKAALSHRKERKAPGLQPGGQIIREWNGVSHQVEVLDNGFRWQGRTYQSLSAIAKAITGTQWSGPRFFGLKARANG